MALRARTSMLGTSMLGTSMLGTSMLGTSTLGTSMLGTSTLGTPESRAVEAGGLPQAAPAPLRRAVEPVVLAQRPGWRPACILAWYPSISWHGVLAYIPTSFLACILGIRYHSIIS